MPGYGLYYPYIHFRDDAWLKTTALYWPKMHRIVPDGYRTEDSDTVRALTAELGFIEDVDPGAAAEAVAVAFSDALSNHADELCSRYAIPPYAARHLMAAPDGRRAMADPATNPFRLPVQPPQHPDAHRRWGPLDLAGIYRDHLAPSVIAQMLQLGLAVQLGRGPWYGMKPDLAWIYMCMLADEIARTRGLIAMTNEVAAHSVTGGTVAQLLTEPHGPRSASQAEIGLIREQLALMAVQTIVPANIGAVPIETIIGLRTKYEAEFDAFTTAVDVTAAELATTLVSVTDVAARQSYLSDEVRKRFLQPKKEISAAIKSAHLDTAFSITTLKAELPLATVPAVAGFQTGHPVIGTGIGLALSVLNLQRTARQKLNAAMKPSAGSYLIRAEDNLTPRSMLGQVKRSLTKLVGLAP